MDIPDLDLSYLITRKRSLFAMGLTPSPSLLSFLPLAPAPPTPYPNSYSAVRPTRSPARGALLPTDPNSSTSPPACAIAS